MKPSPAGRVRGKNDYIALDSLLFCPRDGAEAQISDENQPAPPVLSNRIQPPYDQRLSR